MNNMKKTLAILEIICPAFYRADDGRGNVDYNTPLGRMFFLPRPIVRAYRNIWSQKGKDEDKIITFTFNVITSLLLFPVAFVSWIISQFVFAMHYDHNQRKRGNKSYLMLFYSFIGVLVLSLIVMSIDYSINKQSRYIDLTPKVFAGMELEQKVKPERNIIRSYTDDCRNSLVGAESEHKQSSASEDCDSSTTVEPIVTTTEIVSEVIVNEEEGYTLKRKERD